MIEAQHRRHILLPLALLAVLPYLNALRAGFTYDDVPYIVNNPAVTGEVDLIRLLALPLPSDVYRPLTVLTWALNQKLTPGLPVGFHAVNVLLHAGVTLLVFACATQLFGSRGLAIVAATLFAVHPIHTEAVSNVVGRAEILAALFGLLALASAARADTMASRSRRIAWQSLSVISFSLGLMSKENALTVLLLIPLFRIACRHQPLWRGLVTELRGLDWLPYALCAAVFVTLHYYVIAAEPNPFAIIPQYNMLAFVPWTVRIRSAVGVLWDYFGLLNFPLVLAADYSYDQVPLLTSWLSPRFVAGIALLVGSGILVGRHPRPAVKFAAAFPFVALLVTANVLFPIWTIKAERLLYLPSVGWSLLVAYAFHRLVRHPRYRPIAVGALCLALAFFAVRTWNRNWDWQDNAALYRSMARAAPDSAKAQYALGVALLTTHADYREAAAQFSRSFAIYPRTDAAVGLGLALENQARIDDAIGWYETGLRITPESSEAHTVLCGALLRSKRFEAAVSACRRGLRYHPTNTDLLKGLGGSLIGMGLVDKGTHVLQRALALNGHDDDLRSYLSQLAVDPRSVSTSATGSAGASPAGDAAEVRNALALEAVAPAQPVQGASQ